MILLFCVGVPGSHMPALQYKLAQQLASAWQPAPLEPQQALTVPSPIPSHLMFVLVEKYGQQSES